MAKLTLTWHTAGDDRVCPVCQALDGYTWIFDTSTGPHMTEDLSHPSFGKVWNVNNGSSAHTHAPSSCRCHIEHEFDLSDLVQKAQKLYDAVEMAMNE